jgi:hypothetical protein
MQRARRTRGAPVAAVATHRPAFHDASAKSGWSHQARAAQWQHFGQRFKAGRSSDRAMHAQAE